MQVKKPSRSEFIEVRGRRMHVRHWGPAEARPIVLLHGWCDVSASYQFVVDCLRGEWRVIAPDLRGFGLTQWNDDGYLFADYLGDLENMLDRYVGETSVPVVGHSMGGNIAALYAGVRPQRISHFVNLEGVGLPQTRPEQAPQRYADWLDALKDIKPFRRYSDFDALARRLCSDNPRLTPERGRFLADHIARRSEDGDVELTFDPRHRRSSPVLYRLEEMAACWRQVEAPTLWVTGEDSSLTAFLRHDPDDIERRKQCFRNHRAVMLAQCGHNIHHDQPEQVAALIEEFLS